MSFVPHSVEREEDVGSIIAFVKWRMQEVIIIAQAYDIHSMLYGVPCGPTLEMINEESAFQEILRLSPKELPLHLPTHPRLGEYKEKATRARDWDRAQQGERFWEEERDD